MSEVYPDNNTERTKEPLVTPWSTPLPKLTFNSQVKTYIISVVATLLLVGGVAIAESQMHVVKSGDTLSEIAQAYGVDVNVLAQKNGISNPDMIYVGDELVIVDGIDNDSSGLDGAINDVSVSDDYLGAGVLTYEESLWLQGIRHTESKGDYNAHNPNDPETGAWGAYQFVDSTWQHARTIVNVGNPYNGSTGNAWTGQGAPVWEQDQTAVGWFRYLVDQTGSLWWATAAWNCGLGCAQGGMRGLPIPTSTANHYVSAVMAFTGISYE